MNELIEILGPWPSVALIVGIFWGIAFCYASPFVKKTTYSYTTNKISRKKPSLKEYMENQDVPD